MLRYLTTFAAGIGVGASMVVASASPSAQPSAPPPAGGSFAQLRIYTIDKGRLEDFAAAWRAGVYTLRVKMGYRIPFAATIPETNQFVWVVAYDGPESWEKKEAAYYASPERKQISPDPAQWIARPERVRIHPVVGPAAGQ